jgi:RimJ/RimL family protein N-acetyltransferase
LIRLRPYDEEDTDKILSWINDEITFYKWSAGILGEYPITKERFGFITSLMAFTAVNENDDLVGFFTMRRPTERYDELRFGFVIVDPEKRGKGYGKDMLLSGIDFAKNNYGAKKISIGVFENNKPAYACYKSIGFKDVVLEEKEKYFILGEVWNCLELEMNL